MKLVFVIFSFLLPVTLVLGNPKTKVLKPKNVESKISVVIFGKNRTYYPLLFKNPTVVSAKGPGKLKIITRAQFDSQTPKSLDYSIFYSINGDKKTKIDFNDAKPDGKATFKDKSLGFPGTGESFVVELNRGDNTIELWYQSEKPEIIARFLFTEIKEKKIDWISLSPSFPNEPVSLVTNEEVVTYYRFSLKKSLKIKITGPTTLRVFNRVENHYQMKGRIDYRLQVKEDGKIKNTYQLSSVRSDVTVYKKSCGRTPGKAKEIFITVPGGTHVYEILPLDKDKDSILGKILFPKKDVKLKE
ncbi:MAG: hypothetical protein OQK57_04055 [Ignavibacteriaceae bacterium]|nr:hypothetical protein [Ignavibacteriaceae bacterium]